MKFKKGILLCTIAVLGLVAGPSITANFNSVAYFPNPEILGWLGYAEYYWTSDSVGSTQWGYTYARYHNDNKVENLYWVNTGHRIDNGQWDTWTGGRAGYTYLVATKDWDGSIYDNCSSTVERMDNTFAAQGSVWYQ